MSGLHKLKILLLVVIVAALVVLAGLDYFLPFPMSELVFIGQKPEQNSVFQPIVYIAGAINHPGVYRIEADSRITDVISLAGGFSDTADSNFVAKQLNLAKIVQDEQHIFIPFAAVTEETSAETGLLVNLNTASLEKLLTLPGIGESTANKIVDARPFSSIEDLLEVSGIGTQKYNQIKDLVTV